ncbi:MAG: FecR domain-containing protein, partial [Deltaproteobacteria bacterium]|nr:FecR domain-containing protein [Deltaproteobacteria bacterium]
MKHQKSGPALLIPLLIILFAHLPNAAIAEETNEEWVARIVSVQGVVQALRSQETQWVSVKLNDTYYSGDMIRVHKKSRAAIVLQNATIVRLDQNTTISFALLKEKRSSLINLIMGAVHFFSRIPKRLDIHTPFLNAAIEGTEFFLGVDEKRALLSVFKGSVVAKNELGSITITSGQSAVAEKNYQPT